MRVSVLNDDPGNTYKNDAYKYDIFLDGEKQEFVITADEAEGKVLAYAFEYDAKGNRRVVFDHEKGEFKIEWRSGIVEIKLKAIYAGKQD